MQILVHRGGALANEVLKQLVALGLANDGTRIRNSESGDTYTDGSICDYYSVIRNSKRPVSRELLLNMRI